MTRAKSTLARVFLQIKKECSIAVAHNACMLPVLQYGPIVRYTSGDLSYGLSIRPIMLPSQAVLGRGIPLVLGIWDYPWSHTHRPHYHVTRTLSTLARTSAQRTDQQRPQRCRVCQIRVALFPAVRYPSGEIGDMDDGSSGRKRAFPYHSDVGSFELTRQGGALGPSGSALHPGREATAPRVFQQYHDEGAMHGVGGCRGPCMHV